MGFQFDAPETVDTGGGNWLREPGTYHAIVTAVDEEAKKKNGEFLNAFRVSLQVFDGTVPDQKDKTFDLLFFNPKLTDKNEGMFARQKQARFFISTGLLDESKLGGKGLNIELADAVGRQVVATVELRDEKYIDLHFADIWHIDDPEAAGFPKLEDALKLLPANHRRTADSFKREENGSGGSGKDATAPQTQTATVDDDLGDL